MKIKEVEAATGLTRANIRFYESKGLFQPERQGNNYRDYSEADVEALKKIFLLRKLGISIEELQALFAGEITLQDSVSAAKENMERQITELQGAVKLCEELQKNQETMETLQSDRYLSHLDEMERSGLGFFGITGDMVERYKRDVLSEWMGAPSIKGKMRWGVLLMIAIDIGLSFSNNAMMHAPAWLYLLTLVTAPLGLILATIIYPFYDRLSQRCKIAAYIGWVLFWVSGMLIAGFWIFSKSGLFHF